MGRSPARQPQKKLRAFRSKPRIRRNNPISRRPSGSSSIRSEILLASIEQIARKDNIGRSSELSRRLDACYTMESLALQSGEIADTISSIVSNAVEEIHFTNNFLTELSENLLVMEEQLFSCQSHNQ